MAAARTVLVVDDNPDFLEQMALQLEALGFAVTRAAGERAAEQELAAGQFDLAVVDLMMENRDSGFSLCYHIKKRSPRTPVIVVTAVAAETGMTFDATSREERAWFSADVVLDKPVRIEQLRREIARLLPED